MTEPTHTPGEIVQVCYKHSSTRPAFDRPGVIVRVETSLPDAYRVRYTDPVEGEETVHARFIRAHDGYPTPGWLRRAKSPHRTRAAWRIPTDRNRGVGR